MAALVAACSSDPNAKNPCPAIVAAPGADAIYLFRPGGKERKDVVIAGRVYSTQITCYRRTAGIDANAEIQFYAERINNQVKNTELPYFVALVDPAQHVLSQQAFQVPIVFLPGEGYRRTPPEKITIHLPLRNRAEATAYSVIVGFQLTPEQMAFNRSLGTR
ncbi:MAG TPA: hypothetical protein VFA22_04020 [Stellaceae bacterium]|nr:hypothetical protein [Stellaceae bacterium]